MNRLGFRNNSINLLRTNYANLSQARYIFEVKYKPKKDADSSKVPYQVKRTPSGNLPVYFETGLWTKNTVVRHVAGNASVLKGELEQILSLNLRMQKGMRGHVLRIPGNHEIRIKEWLHHLGF